MSQVEKINENDSRGFYVFMKLMGIGECLCAEIHPTDKPCLTCAGKLYLGAIAVIRLQSVIGIKVPIEKAEQIWLGFSPSEQEQTMRAHARCFPNEDGFLEEGLT